MRHTQINRKYACRQAKKNVPTSFCTDRRPKWLQNCSRCGAPSAGLEWNCNVASYSSFRGPSFTHSEPIFLVSGVGGIHTCCFKGSAKTHNSATLALTLPLEDVQTFTVKHPSYGLDVLSVLLISKSDCIFLIMCGINKVLKGRKIKLTVTHKSKRKHGWPAFAMYSFLFVVINGIVPPPVLPSYIHPAILHCPPFLSPACESKWDAIKEKSTDTKWPSWLIPYLCSTSVQLLAYRKPV